MTETKKSSLNTDELQLLARLEEANRIFEADEKSLKSLSASNTSSHSRKGSISSMKSTASGVSQFSNLPYEEDHGNSEDTWETWGRIVNDWETYSKKKPQYLKELVRKGVPHHFRGLVWQLLCNAYTSPAKEMYAEYLKRPSSYEKVIRRDIARTYPDHDFFKEKDGLGQESLFNVMKAYSLHDREVGYCQGSGFIVGLLLMQMPEEEAFAVLVTLMEDYKLRDLFKPHMVELGLCMFKLECMLQDYLPELYMHFQSQGFHTSIYASSWFLTLFTTSLPLSVACRIMDIFMSEGFEIIFRIAIAILCQNQVDLLEQDMEGMLRCLQKEAPPKHELDPDSLINTAFQVKINTKRMKKLEKEYTAIKSKEHEDQVELRRLRSENRLLRQRVENLEKETSTLADRLVHDQVTRAQEAEEMFGIKRELAALKNEKDSMAKSLEEAQGVMKQSKKQSSNGDLSNDHRAEEMINQLQNELIKVRLKEAESSSTVRDLKDKVQALEDENDKLQREPEMTIVGLQEELIAVKLREAEANLSMKEMKKKISDLFSAYELYMESVNSEHGPKATRSNIQAIQDEMMAVRMREAETSAELKHMKQRVMELETQNQICDHQLKRLSDENIHLKEKVDEVNERERKIRSEVKEMERKVADNESKRREENMMARIKDAEHSQTIAEMRQRIAELEIENQELVTAGQLRNKAGENDLEDAIADLQEEVLQLRMSSSLNRMSFSMTQLEMESDTDEEEDLDVTIRDNKMNADSLGLGDSWKKDRSNTLTRLNNSLNNNNNVKESPKPPSSSSLQIKSDLGSSSETVKTAPPKDGSSLLNGLSEKDRALFEDVGILKAKVGMTESTKADML